MTSEELREKVRTMKVEAFDLIKTTTRHEPRLSGYKTHEEMALKIVQDTMKKIEKEITKWEKENPL